MSVTVIVDDLKIRGMFSEHAKRGALAATMENVRSDTEPFVPWRSGDMSDVFLDTSQFEEGIIAWRTEYANRVYHMPATCNWTRWRHPQAGPQWVERSRAVNGERWRNMIATRLRGGK